MDNGATRRSLATRAERRSEPCLCVDGFSRSLFAFFCSRGDRIRVLYVCVVRWVSWISERDRCEVLQRALAKLAQLAKTKVRDEVMT